MLVSLRLRADGKEAGKHADMLVSLRVHLGPKGIMARKGRIRSPNRHAIGRFSRQTERGVETSTRGCPILNGDYADLESSRFANGIQHMLSARVNSRH